MELCSLILHVEIINFAEDSSFLRTFVKRPYK